MFLCFQLFLIFSFPPPDPSPPQDLPPPDPFRPHVFRPVCPFLFCPDVVFLVPSVIFYFPTCRFLSRLCFFCPGPHCAVHHAADFELTRCLWFHPSFKRPFLASFPLLIVNFTFDDVVVCLRFTSSATCQSLCCLRLFGGALDALAAFALVVLLPPYLLRGTDLLRAECCLCWFGPILGHSGTHDKKTDHPWTQSRAHNVGNCVAQPPTFRESDPCICRSRRNAKMDTMRGPHACAYCVHQDRSETPPDVGAPSEANLWGCSPPRTSFC